MEDRIKGETPGSVMILNDLRGCGILDQYSPQTEGRGTDASDNLNLDCLGEGKSNVSHKWRLGYHLQPQSNLAM